MRRSLRVRLLVSFGLVILISVTLSGFAAALLLRDQESEVAEDRVARLVGPLASYLELLESVGQPRAVIRQELQTASAYYDIRVLLLDRTRTVVFDSDARDSMLGEYVHVPSEDAITRVDESEGVAAAGTIRFSHSDRDLYLFASDSSGALASVGPATLGNDLSLLVAVPSAELNDAWMRLRNPLLLSSAVAALFAVVVGTLLANRITKPIVQMTHASEAMARGDYDQRIEIRGDGEVANLAQAFNQMAQQVNRSNRAMQQLLANVSHELRTPLTSIQGFSQAMVDGVVEDDEEARRLARVVHEEADRMRVLVDDLLYLSRIEAGGLQLELHRVDLDAVARSTERRLRHKAEARDVTLQLDLQGGSIVGDERRLEQVLTNLVDNAIRFAPQGSEVRLVNRRVADRVHVEVHNGGPPISAEELPYLFDRFHQADPARSDHHAGLGLAIVRELVQAHGGTVEVASTAGGGTVFTVKLPARAEAASDLQGDEPEHGAGTAERGD